MLNDFENYLKLNIDSSETIYTYKRRLTNFFITYNDFNQENINKYLTTLIEQKKSASLINLSIYAFKSYSKFTNILIDFPKSRKITKKIRVSLSRDEIENEIFPYFNFLFTDTDKRKLMVRFMMLTLMRISEVTRLKKQDVNFDTKQINIIGKGGKSRVMFLHNSIIEDLKIEFNKSQGESAFNISNGYIEYIFKQINEVANYKKRVTPHTLRHAGAKYLYENGVSLKIIKELLGHSSLDTTDLYLDYTVEEMQIQYNKVKYKRGK
jgi:site-specific recombinase XerD